MSRSVDSSETSIRGGGKTCTKCGQAKDRAEFPRWAARPDGLHPHCKACKNSAPRDQERKRQWDREAYGSQRYHVPCGRCQAPHPPPHPPNEGGICEDCIRREVKDRRQQIVAWWAEGVRGSEIARRLGWSRGHFANETARMRAEGYDLPYRYRLTKPKHPERVAA